MDSNVLIIGGGIGGLALALALDRHGISATVCERAPELREIGAGLLLTPNASWVLHRLGLLEEIREQARVARSWQILDSHGRPLQHFAAGGDENAPSLSITRAALQTLLCRQLKPNVLRLGYEAMAIEDTGVRDQPAVSFTNGRVISAKIIVGADGGRSIIRRNWFDPSPLQIHRYVGWRALVPDIPDDWCDGLITESWAEGCRFGIAPVEHDRTYWYATENITAEWKSPVGKKAHLLEKFRGWHEPIRHLIEATPEKNILLSDIADHPIRPIWQRDRITLLGDAAHLMTPNLGQGAAMALEDAWVLARCLAEFGLSDTALSLYQKLRWKRNSAVAWQSRHVGGMIQLENPAAWRLRNLALRCTPDSLGNWALSSVFGFRV